MIEELRPDRVLATGAGLAEGPLWEAAEQRLYWTDIEGRKLHRTDLSGNDAVILDGYEVGGFGFHSEGGLVLALPGVIARLEPRSAHPTPMARLTADGPGLRLNDGACDGAGRFWTGSMARDLSPGRARLYCLEGERLRTMLEGISLSNGIDWSGDGRYLYYVDSLTGWVDRFDFDLRDGTLGARVPVANIQGFTVATGGLVVADGLCVDAEECLWVAVHGAGEVRRFSPRGEPLARVVLPVPGVTSCTFGGPLLDTLFVTTAAHAGLVEGSQPGSVYALKTGTRGRPPHRFMG
ncbi:MAG: CBU_1789 family Dot/Icm type IV secretion system effector [Candidatus Dormibacteria bacterium]